MSTTIDQKAYLQKYLGGPSKDKKKKKKKAVKGTGFRIIDDDVDLSKLRPLDGDELDILDEGEDAPQIAGIIDERPEELKKLEQFKTSSKWRVVNKDDGFNSKLQIEEIKKDIKETEKENEIIFGKMYSDSEDEKDKNDSDLSPPRKNTINKHDKKEFSPSRKEQSTNKSKFDPDPSPPRKQDRPKKDRPRKPSRWADADTDTRNSTSPQRRYKNRSPSSDLSPPRKKKTYDSDSSPPRRSHKKDVRDLSDRKHRSSLKRQENSKSYHARSSDSDLSPPRKGKRHNSPKRNSDKHFDNHRKIETSPKRDKERNISDRNKNIVDRDRNIVDRDRNIADRDRNITDRGRNIDRYRESEYERKRKTSPKKSRKKHHSDSDLSPPRKNKKNETEKYIKQESRRSRSPKVKREQIEITDSDESPPRKSKNKHVSKEKQSHKRSSSNSDSDLSPPRRGRITNMPERDRERNKYRDNSDSPPPTNKKMAKTLEGKKAGLQDARQLREENEEFRRKEDDVFKRLGDDVSGKNAKAVSRKSKRDTSEDRQKQREKAERQKELDAKYKMWSRGLKQIEAQQARVQDYMHEASKPLARHKDDRDLEHSLKQVERAGDPMLKYIKDKKRENGDLPPEKPSYKGSYPPNRFNIRPGYRWDGVDRSNGYERKYFEQQSKKKAQEEEAYKWSTEDL